MYRESEPVFPPFPGWEFSAATEEATTKYLGRLEHDIIVFPIDEERLFEQVHHDNQRRPVLRATGGAGTSWLYHSEHVRIGTMLAPPRRDEAYRRILDADEIQYQGPWTAHGGEPAGHCRARAWRPGAHFGWGWHTSIHVEETEHIIVLCDRELPEIGETAKVAETYSRAARRRA